jgi:cbb3-type cytochrome oxidase subunit 1
MWSWKRFLIGAVVGLLVGLAISIAYANDISPFPGMGILQIAFVAAFAMLFGLLAGDDTYRI